MLFSVITHYQLKVVKLKVNLLHISNLFIIINIMIYFSHSGSMRIGKDMILLTKK